jgi:hypothetical protein
MSFGCKSLPFIIVVVVVVVIIIIVIKLKTYVLETKQVSKTLVFSSNITQPIACKDTRTVKASEHTDDN